MPLSYESPFIDTQNAEYDGPILYSYPFATQGDLTHFVARQPYIQQSESYTPPTLSVARTLKSLSAYSVGDTDPSKIDGGCVRFDRMWATIPQTRTVQRGTYAFQFPASPFAAGGSPKTITAASGFTFTSAAHGFSAGDNLILSLVYSLGSGALLASISAVTTDTFTVNSISLPAGTFSSGTATKISRGRSQSKTLPSTSIEVFSYALPGVTSGITTAQDFRPDDLFRVVLLSTGEEVDTVSAGTAPTASEYTSLVATGSYIVAESEIRIYLGQILERRTLMVVAL